MAFLVDALALADEKLLDVFNIVKSDPAKTRKPVLSGIDKTLTQFNEGKTKVPHRWWSVSNSVVAFRPKVGGSPLLINGKDTLYVPVERFPDFLAKLRSAVEAGEFDEELANGGKGEAKVSTPRTPRKPREPGTGGRGWSPERRAAFEATIAARKAAKG